MANTATSMYFDGGEDTIKIQNHDLKKIIGTTSPMYTWVSSNPWTVEAWLYHSGSFVNMDQTYKECTWFQFGDIFIAGQMQYNTTSKTVPTFYHYSGTTNYFEPNPNDTYENFFYKDQWMHVAVQNDPESGRYMFLNGRLVNHSSTAVSVPSNLSDDHYLAIGGHAESSYEDWEGYIDEFRFSKTARYGSFKAPTAVLDVKQTASVGMNTLKPENITVLLQSDNNVANGTNVIGSTSNKGSGGGTIANSNGTSKIVTNEHLPWKNTSFLINGKVDRWYLSSGTDPEPFASFGREDFSIEGWFKNSAPSGTGYNMPLRVTHNGGPSSAWYINIPGSSGTGAAAKTHFYYYDSPAVTVTEVTRHDAGDFSEWTHLAITRENRDKICIFSNGRLIAANNTGQYEASHSGGTDYRLQFNYDHTDTNVNDAGTVYVDDVRICKGVSAYTANFNPYGGQKNVVSNRGGALTDVSLASANTHAIQMGRAAIGSGTGANFASNANTYCFDFDGTADYLLHETPAYRSSDDRGTIFAWIYLDTINEEYLFTSSDTAGTDDWLGIYFEQVSSDGKLKFQYKASSPSTTNYGHGDTTITTAAWHSVAVVSSGTAWTFYVDGTAESITMQGGTNDGSWFGDNSTRDNISIGALVRSSVVSSKFDGKIMQVAYFGGSVADQGVLTAAQIAALHSAGKGHDLTTATGVYTASEIDDLHGYWRMGNHYLDTPRVIYDASGNGYTMTEVSDPQAFTYDTGTTFHEGWQHRGYFDSDRYTSLLIQSSNHEGSTSFVDRGPGFKKIEFNGTDANLSTGAAYRENDKSGSIATWIKWGGLSGGTADTLFGGFTSDGTHYMYLAVLASTLYWDFNTGTDATRVAGPITTGINIGEWSHIVVTQTGDPDDAEPLKFYVNGSKATYNPSDHNKRDHHELWFDTFNSTNFSIGSWQTTGSSSTDHTKAQMSQFAVWGDNTINSSGVLSAADVAAIYALGPNGNVQTDYSGALVDYWTMGNITTEGDDLVTSGTTVYSQVSGTFAADLSKGGTISAPFSQHSLTHAGTALNHSTVASVYGGSSLHFDGTAVKSLVAADSPDWKLGTGDWTLECWTKPEQTSGNQCWLSHGDGTSPRTGWYWAFYGTSGGADHERKIAFDYYNSGTAEVQDNTKPGVIKFYVWQHIAVTHTRSGTTSTYQHYHDGILVHEFTAANTVTATTGELKIGTNTQGSPAGTEDPFSGYIDEIRISSGVRRYSKSIERFANTFVAKGDTGDAYTALQIQSNGAKNGASYSDTVNRTGYNTSAVTVAGIPIWRNTVGDGFGGANTALYFRGGADYITFADSAEWDLVGASLTNWTHEVWVYHDQAVAYGSYIGQFEDTNNKWFFGANGYAWGQLYSGTVTNWTISDTTVTIPVREWVHIVFQRRNGGYEQYMNGVLIATQYTYANDTYSGVLKIGEAGDPSWNDFVGYMDQIRLSVGIARYGKIQLRTAQQTHVSANSDSGVITSNSTFGSANNIFETDGHTVMLLNGDELYANTLVVSGAHTFHRNVGGNNVSNVTTTFATSVQANVERVGGTTGNVYTINGALRPTDLVLVRDNHYNFHISNTNYSSHPLKFSTTSGGTHSPGGTEYTTGITVVQEAGSANTLVKFSPTSATPDTLYYYCSSHNLMGGQITVTDSTGSDGKIATQPFAMFKGDGTAAAGGPTQYKGVSAYGANSYYYDGTDVLRSTQAMVGGGTIKGDNFDFGKEDFTIEYWEYPNVDNGDHIWTIGGGSPAAQRVFEAYYGGNTTFNLVYGLGGTASPNFNAYNVKADEWAHIAIQGRWNKGNGFLEVWRNGQLQNTSPSITTAISSLSTISTGSPALYLGGLYASAAYQGFFDSWRISKGIARYGYSGTNTKLGTSAVHHSHAKLLITSNTSQGNTHFDDLSDQGNYWNQQPSGYFFDGGNDYIYTTATNNNATHTVGIWFLWDGVYETSYNIFYDTRVSTAGGDGYLIGLYNGAFFIYGEGISSGSQITYPNPTVGSWNFISTVVENAGGSGTIKVYLNGAEVGSGTAASTCINNDGTNGTIYLGKSRYENTRYHAGRMAQFGLWSSALSAANQETLWAAGPTANWTTDFSDNMEIYYAMGNHNNLAGRPADKGGNGLHVFDRSGNGRDATLDGAMVAPNKGNVLKAHGNVKHSTNIKNFGSSAIYFDGDAANYLSLPIQWKAFPGAKFGTDAFTVEGWVYPLYDGDQQNVFVSSYEVTGWIIEISQAGADSASHSYARWRNQASSDDTITTANGLVQINAWAHIAVCRENNRGPKMYWNGILVGSNDTNRNYGPSMVDDLLIGRYSESNGNQNFKGYMDEIAIYKGTSKYNSVVTGLGTATITPSYLPDPTGNHFTTSGIAVTDQMLDTPENNFCTLNPLTGGGTMALGQGNLSIVTNYSPDLGGWAGTFMPSTGKWYWEVKIGGASTYPYVGITTQEYYSRSTSNDAGAFYNIAWLVAGTGANSGTSLGTISKSDISAFTTGDVLSFQLDVDARKLFVAKNGVYENNGDPVNGTGESASWTTDEPVSPFISGYQSQGVGSQFNFGQGDPDGENNFTDGNGRGGFRHEPPQGFVSLCTANLKDADYAPIGPNSAAGTPDKHFDTLLYMGNRSSENMISGLNFQPDLVWMKSRDFADNGVLCSSLQGELKAVYSSSSSAEVTNGVLSFNSDGFTLGDWNNVNDTGDDFVAWCWKAGNKTVVDNSGDLPATRSTNVDAGFSIIMTEGTDANNQKIPHGLGKAPEWIIGKQLDNAYNWDVFHVGCTAGSTLILNSTATQDGTRDAYYNAGDGPVDSQFIYAKDEMIVSGGGKRSILYAWTGIEGYSKFGSYEGNNNADGSIVYTGFKPAWIMIKNIDATTYWTIFDNKRSPNNVCQNTLSAEHSRVEATDGSNGTIDILSNGFKCRSTDSGVNAAQTYIYMAFAEMPFKYATGR